MECPVMWSHVSSFLEIRDLLHLFFLNQKFSNLAEDKAFTHLFYLRCESLFNRHMEVSLHMGTTDENEKDAYCAIYMLYGSSRHSFLRYVSSPLHKKQCSYYVFVRVEQMHRFLTVPHTLSWFVREYGPPTRLYRVSWWMNRFSHVYKKAPVSILFWKSLSI